MQRKGTGWAAPFLPPGVIRSMSEQNKPDHRLHASITTKDDKVEGVLCEIYLPKKVTDPVGLFFRPTTEQSHLLDYVLEFSFYGEIKDVSGEVREIIEADKVYHTKSSTRHWGPELSETLLVGEPVDLRIIELLNEDNQADRSKEALQGTFWLTPNAMLSPMYSRTLSFTGNVTIEKVRSFEFTLSNGLHLTFSHHYRYLDNENGETVSFPELVAEFKIGTEKMEVGSLLQGVDDFLMLTSFAARQSCVCLGWDSYDPSKVVRYFRRDVAIPKQKKGHSMHDGLIEVTDFAEFIRTAYTSFVGIERKDLIRQAVHRAISGRDGTLESNYLILYSALETLVLFCRQEFDNELIGQLNRVPFRTAFDGFCRHFDVDVIDLWPVVDRKDGVSLADVRNRLIHGDSFNPLQERALISAKEQLRWVVERSVLSVLGWQVRKSKVSKEYLSKMTMYKEWREGRKILSELDEA